MTYADRRQQAKFYFDETVALLRQYIKNNRPQSFASCWELFRKTYKDAKYFGVSTPVMDLFKYAQNEHIERFGVNPATLSYI